MRRLVDHERARQRRDRGEQLAARLGRRGRNPRNRKRSASSPAADTAAIAALAPGIGTTGNPASRTARTSRAPGIADGGRSGVAHQRDAAARAQHRDDCAARAVLVVRVQRQRPRRDAVVAQQHRRHARVLGRDRRRRCRGCRARAASCRADYRAAWRPHIMFPASARNRACRRPPMPQHRARRSLIRPLHVRFRRSA